MTRETFFGPGTHGATFSPCRLWRYSLWRRWSDCAPDHMVAFIGLNPSTADGHAQLSKLLRRFSKTRVIVSYYEHPDLGLLYPGWTKRRLKATKSLVNQGMRDKSGAVAAPEVLLINGSSLVAESGLFGGHS